MAVTLKQVAQKAEVSHSAVSTALNGSDNSKSGTRVSEATREKVKRAADELGYVADPFATAMRGGRTKTIGVLWSFGAPSAEGMIAAISNKIWEKGYAAQLISSLSDSDLIPQALEDLLRRRVDGVVFQGSRKLLENPKINSRLDQFPATVAVTDQPLDIPYSQLARDTPSAINQVVDYLVDSGRKRICLLELSSSHSADTNTKSIAFVERLRYHNLPVENAVIKANRKSGLHYPFGHIDDFKNALEQKFPDNFPYDALLGSNDEAAVAGLEHLRKLGKKVPEDVAVIGFDNVELIRACDPPLASIGQDQQKAAKAITKLLFNKLEKPNSPCEQEIAPMQFFWRKSAGGCEPAAQKKQAEHPDASGRRAGLALPESGQEINQTLLTH